MNHQIGLACTSYYQRWQDENSSIVLSKAKESIEACDDPDPEFRRIMCSIAASGAVAAVALVDGADFYVASTGDCSVVLGSLSENDTWIAKKLPNNNAQTEAALVDSALALGYILRVQ